VANPKRCNRTTQTVFMHQCHSDTLALAFATGTTPSTAAVRNYRSKYGVAINLEQQIAPSARLSAGHYLS